MSKFDSVFEYDSSSPSSDNLPIAVDAMGGDFAPREIVKGALQAKDLYGIPVVLLGNAKAIKQDMGNIDIPIINTTEIIQMCDDPGNSVRTKRNSSLVRTAELVRDGKACAMIGAGNTGATMASALLKIGRLQGVARPAIATLIPVPKEKTPMVLLDAGANADCQPSWLVQFAKMGSAFFRIRFGIKNPRVALLSIGEESSKGNEFVKSTHELLSNTSNINFIGNIEGRDFLRPVADVVVTDGFTGNIVLKTLEGGVGYIVDSFLENFKKNLTGKIAGMLIKKDMKPFLQQLDPSNYGGAMLLGLKGVCVISHGSSKAKAIVNAIKVAKDMSNANIVNELKNALADTD